MGGWGVGEPFLAGAAGASGILFLVSGWVAVPYEGMLSCHHLWLDFCFDAATEWEELDHGAGWGFWVLECLSVSPLLVFRAPSRLILHLWL
jgi:hypothetical protein